MGITAGSEGGKIPDWRIGVDGLVHIPPLLPPFGFQTTHTPLLTHQPAASDASPVPCNSGRAAPHPSTHHPSP